MTDEDPARQESAGDRIYRDRMAINDAMIRAEERTRRELHEATEEVPASALSDAEQAVAGAEAELLRELTSPTEWVTGEHGSNDRDARRLTSRLIAAVRRHDAEIVRALPYEPGSDTIKDAWKAGQESAADAIADRLRPGPFPEVEVRFVGGPTVRIARFTVTTEAEVGLVAVEGFLSSWTGYPNSGDAVRIAYLGIPGRGALADITASVAVYTRMEVLNIRIRTTIRPWEPTP